MFSKSPLSDAQSLCVSLPTFSTGRDTAPPTSQASNETVAQGQSPEDHPVTLSGYHFRGGARFPLKLKLRKPSPSPGRAHAPPCRDRCFPALHLVPAKPPVAAKPQWSARLSRDTLMPRVLPPARAAQAAGRRL